VTGSALEDAPDEQLSRNYDLLEPLERVSVDSHPASTDLATTDVAYSYAGEDEARDNARDARASVAEAATDNASARNVSLTASPVLLDQAPEQLPAGKHLSAFYNLLQTSLSFNAFHC